MTIPTNWKNRLGPLDLQEGWDGAPIWPRIEGTDAPVPVDLSSQLATGESIVSPTARLFRLRNVDELADVEQNTKITLPIAVSGTVASVRLQGLERGRYYRLEVLHGAAGNRRGRSILVWVQD